MGDYTKVSKSLLEFIEKNPTCFHVVDNVSKKLTEAGFTELPEASEWKIEKGGKYFVTRNGSALLAFKVPEKKPLGFHIIAAHSDSPNFKVKEAPEMIVEDKYVKLNTEKYGGMIVNTWLDRPLGVAGRVAVKDGKKIVTKLVNLDKDICVIPNLAIHMNRDINKGYDYNPQVDMLPLFADNADSNGKGALLKKVAASLKVKEENILAHDLFLYVHDKGRIFGENGDFILSGRLDDQQCVFCEVEALLASDPKDYVDVCAIFDNEEVGSGTKQGADSTLLEDVLYRICEGLGGDKTELIRMVAESFLISADNAHAVHPNHPEKADPTNRPYLNGGIVIKYHGSQKYCTDAVSAAVMKDLCNRAGVPFQTFCNRSDAAGGSTLGNLSTAHVSVSSVDIGLPQLAMHSAVETAGIRDTEYCIKVFNEFYAE